jgi:gas vesicle protein
MVFSLFSILFAGSVGFRFADLLLLPQQPGDVFLASRNPFFCHGHPLCRCEASETSFSTLTPYGDALIILDEYIASKNHFCKGGVIMSDNNCGDWVKGLLIGGLVGVIIGLLYAPKSGKETRDELSDKAKDVAGKLKDEYEVAFEKSKSAYENLLKKLKEVEAKAEQKAQEMGGGSVPKS